MSDERWRWFSCVNCGQEIDIHDRKDLNWHGVGHPMSDSYAHSVCPEQLEESMTATSDKFFKALEEYEGDPFTVSEWAAVLKVSYSQMSYAMKAALKTRKVKVVSEAGSTVFYQKASVKARAKKTTTTSTSW